MRRYVKLEPEHTLCSRLGLLYGHRFTLPVLVFLAVQIVIHLTSSAQTTTAVQTTGSHSSEALANSPTTVITVTAEPLSVSTAPASVSVVTQQDVSESYDLTSADLMRTVPFANVAQNGSAGALTTLTLRGSKANQVLVMIDGIPATDLSNLLGGAFDFSSLAGCGKSDG